MTVGILKTRLTDVAPSGTPGVTVLNARLTNQQVDENFLTLYEAINGHVDKVAGAHAATSISFSDAGFSAGEVSSALTELNGTKLAKANNLSDLTDAATARSHLGLGTIATAAAADYLPSAGGTLTGDLTLSGSGRRIKGDFGNATQSNRLVFQTSTTNGPTAVGALPDGTGTVGVFVGYGGSDPNNTHLAIFGANPQVANTVGIDSWALGTGTVRPMVFSFSGVEKLRLGTSGELTLSGSGADTIPALTGASVAGEIHAGAGSDYGFLRLSAGGAVNVTQKTAIDIQGYGTTDGAQIRFYTYGTERFRLTGASFQNAAGSQFIPNHTTAATIANGTSTGAPLEVRCLNDAGSAAFMAFHRPSQFAAFFGIDTDNQFKVGGWSMGVNSYVVLHEGNSFLLTGGNLNAASRNMYVKDITASRGDGSGVIFLNGANTRYLYFDGGRYVFPGSPVDANIFRETHVAATFGATTTLDCSTGGSFSFTASGSGAATLSFSNPPASNLTAPITVEITNGGLRTWTWPSGTKWAGGTAPTLTSSGTDILQFYTRDGGTTWRGFLAAKDSK